MYSVYFILIITIFTLIYYKNLSNILIDDNISKFLVNNLNFFRFIHPNFISLISIILNYFIYIYLICTVPHLNIYLFSIILFIRWLSDCLDGAIARKYNKTSKLGHSLDTLGDILLFYIFMYFILNKLFHIPNISAFIIISNMILLFNIGTRFIDDHDELKNRENSQNYLKKNLGFLIRMTSSAECWGKPGACVRW